MAERFMQQKLLAFYSIFNIEIIHAMKKMETYGLEFGDLSLGKSSLS